MLLNSQFRDVFFSISRWLRTLGIGINCPLSQRLRTLMSDDPAPTQTGDRPGDRTDGAGEGAPRKWRGSSRAYLLQRLKEAGRDDLIEAVESRRISDRAAAVGMGWLREYEPVSPDNSRTRRRQFEMTEVFGGTRPSHVAVLQELWLGPNSNEGSLFRSREELHAAWLEHRDEVMAEWGSNGRRPAAWYEFEAPPDLHDDYDRERSQLYERGLLGIDEAARVQAEWRQEFDRAQTRFRTDAERRRYYCEIDLPDSLRKEWEAERRRRRKTVRARKDPPAQDAEPAAGDAGI